MSASDSGPLGALGWLIVLGGGALFGILWGMVHIPPYMANREIQTAVTNTLSKVAVASSDDDVLNHINEVISGTKTSRYWVDDDGVAHDAMDFQLKKDDITFSRNGNHSISADVSYTQETIMPLLKSRKVMTYSFHVDGAEH